MNLGYGLFYQSIYEIWGSKGMLNLSRAYNIPSDMSASLKINTTKVTEIKIKPANHFKLMINNFSKEIQNKRKRIDFEKDIINQAKVMEAARISNKEKRMVKISEIK
jgi:predicted dehydrogenase